MKYKSNNLSAWAQRLLLLFILITISGCQSDEFTNTPAQPFPATVSPKPWSPTPTLPMQSMVLREGDTVTVSLPSSPTLDTTQQIRPDGKIVLPLVNEVVAAGKTPEELQDELLKLYQPQVSAKQVIVTVQSPNIPVYVTGAVMRPGPVTVNHPISALDAIMEAGGFDFTKANMKAVVVVRQEKDRTEKFKLDLKKAWSGSTGAPFYLEPYDIVYVPERFTWY